MAADKTQPEQAAHTANLPVIIIGAGISGLSLAQHLRQLGIPFRIFERDTGVKSRGVGWGLTLNWSLPMLRSLVTPELLSRFPETYVDRQGIETGLCPRFPFYDLSNGDLKATTPPLPETWGRTLSSFVETSESHFSGATRHGKTVTVTFEDGSKCVGSLLVACDGSNSRVRRALFPSLASENLYRIPIAVMGVKIHLSTAQIAGMRELDPYFLQGTSSQNDSFVYMSVLDAPGNSPENDPDSYNLQICLSWPYRDGYLGRERQLQVPDSQESRHKLFHEFAATYAEPFSSILRAVTVDTEIKQIDLCDWPPPIGLHTKGNVVLMGDAMHQMAMYRGEGANHAIADVVDFATHVVPLLGRDETAFTGSTDIGTIATVSTPAEPEVQHVASSRNPVNGNTNRHMSEATNISIQLRTALDAYENVVVNRARPGVLASRRACLDAHDWTRIGPQSPLLSRRQKDIVYDEVADMVVG
ncbi:hypothetical protein QQS21_010042 [Conoideocrella luteorostrata]|uniref:FAD-binding domain-containing protein n=1 Tax=Conoideocrella luteorostrata TaxID=1105319 RepID=A0AAJ0CG35_9HYPO|nr:hypothetical protein QQS21_010042 [Conoideocrella luteorostrata]